MYFRKFKIDLKNWCLSQVSFYYTRSKPKNFMPEWQTEIFTKYNDYKLSRNVMTLAYKINFGINEKISFLHLKKLNISWPQYSLIASKLVNFLSKKCVTTFLLWNTVHFGIFLVTTRKNLNLFCYVPGTMLSIIEYRTKKYYPSGNHINLSISYITLFQQDPECL